MSSRTFADLSTGLLGLALSGGYVWLAGGIEDSLLADEVGAAGVPSGVGYLMMLASAALLFKAVLRGWLLQGRTSTPSASDDGGEEGGGLQAHAQALGLLAILLAYVLLLPWVGYVLALSALVVAVAMYAGGRNRSTLLLLAVVVGPLLWLIFDRLLEVRMPKGMWSAWLGA